MALQSLFAIPCSNAAVIFASTISFADEKPAPPKELVKVLEYYVGNWAITGSLGDIALKGKASFRMPAGKHCIIGTVNCRGKDGPFIFSLLCFCCLASYHLGVTPSSAAVNKRSIVVRVGATAPPAAAPAPPLLQSIHGAARVSIGRRLPHLQRCGTIP